MSDICAFIVGVDDYDQRDWRLHGPSAGALAIVEWLLCIGTRPENIFLFVSLLDDAPKATQEKLETLIARDVHVCKSAKFEEIDNFYRKSLKNISKSGSRLFVYWAGHGVGTTDRTRLLICQDFTVNELNNRVFNATQFINHVNSNEYIGISECIFLVDACAVVTGLRLDAKVTPPSSTAKNSQILAYFGSKIGDYATAEFGSGVFTKDVLDILREFQQWPNLNSLSSQMRIQFKGGRYTSLEIGGVDLHGEFESGGGGFNAEVLAIGSAPDGFQRQKVLSDLLEAWRIGGRNAALLTGFVGIGKSDRVARTLISHASKVDVAGICIAVPAHPTNLDEELLSRLLDELQDDKADLLKTVKSKNSFVDALRSLLARGALVVVDDFQRVLDQATGRPIGVLAEKYQRIALRAKDSGCLLLIANREMDPSWSEPFYIARIKEPAEFGEKVNIVLGALESLVYEEKFPTHRRQEVIDRLGANPRLLRLLGQLLNTYSLDELLGPIGSGLGGATTSKFINAIESALLAKAREGLSDSASRLLVNLSIFEEPIAADLVEAMCPTEGKLSEALDELRVRYLIEVRSGRYVLHPAVREFELQKLRADAEQWKSANRLAGMWFALPLIEAKSTPLEDFQIASLLAGARYHLLEADATAELEQSLQGIAPYIERKFGWEARRPTSSEERDAQIDLLRLYLKIPRYAGVEFNFAKLLRSRNEVGDLEEAYGHAKLAKENCDFSDPWVLWIQIVRLTEGVAKSLVEAKMAVEYVAPDKSLVSVYQLLGLNLAHSGETEEAVRMLRKGANLIEEAAKKKASKKGNDEMQSRPECAELLIQEALFFAAAEDDVSLLQSVYTEICTNARYKPEKALAEVLLCEHRGDWMLGAELARRGRIDHGTYLHLALHEAWCWLAAGDPETAQIVLKEFRLKPVVRAGSIWLASLVALFADDLPEASRLLSTYLGEDAPASGIDIYRLLLSEWDNRVATIGEANPALNFPILPSAIWGSDYVVRRRQYGQPVLGALLQQQYLDLPVIARKKIVLLDDLQAKIEGIPALGMTRKLL